MIDHALVEALTQIVGERHVRTAGAERATYAKDGLTVHRRLPAVVVLPGSRDEVIAVVRLLAVHGVPFVPRGAGTGLSGGALADQDAVLLVLTRLNRILKVDPRNRVATVEPGVVNVKLSVAAAPHGLLYAPDPSSQSACTIGGNVAENAGGPHCLKYGVTATHVLALEVVLADGQVVQLGSPGGEPWGPDLVGLFVGLAISTGRVYVSTFNSIITFAYGPPLDTWTHLSVEADSTGTTLYVNGVLSQTLAAVTLGTGSTAAVAIGSSADDDDHFAGVIDDLHLYSRALSQTEVQTDMSTPVGAADTTPPTAPTGLTATE